MRNRPVISGFVVICLLLAGSGWSWFVRQQCQVNPEGFELIERDMTCDEVSLVLGAAPLPESFRATELGANSNWCLSRNTILRPIRVGAVNHQRREWIGDGWGIAVVFDVEGRTVQKVLWRARISCQSSKDDDE